MAALAHHINDAEVLASGLKAVLQACIKFEYMKNCFDEATPPFHAPSPPRLSLAHDLPTPVSQAGIVELLVNILKAHPEAKEVCKVACQVMRALVLRDDHREQTDQCFDRARELNEKKALQEACTTLKSFQKDLDIVPVILSTLACAALNKVAPTRTPPVTSLYSPSSRRPRKMSTH